MMLFRWEALLCFLLISYTVALGQKPKEIADPWSGEPTKDARPNLTRFAYKGEFRGKITQWDEKGRLTGEGYGFMPFGEYNHPGYISSGWNALYYSTGQLLMEMYTLSYPQGVIVEWFPDGKLKRIHEPRVSDFQWMQNGKLMYAVYYNEDTQQPLDTLIDSKKTEEIYHRFSSAKVKHLSLQHADAKGKITSYYDESQPRFETYLRNGRMDSLFRGYYPDGSLMVEWQLRNGVPHGRYQFYNSNHTPRDIGFYTDGKATGVWKNYSFKGVLRSESEIDTTVKGKTYPSHTYKKEYSEKGKLEHFNRYKNGKPEGIQETWAENGQLISRYNWSQEKAEGWNEQFYLDGKPSSKMLYKNGVREGEEISWYENGNKRYVGHNSADHRNGASTSWYENGKLYSKGSYKNNKKDGVWKYYGTNGKEERKVTYQLGKEILVPNGLECNCAEPQLEWDYPYTNIDFVLEEEYLHDWEFPFHESIEKYMGSLWMGRYDPSHEDDRGYLSLDLITDTLLELGIPDKNGIKMVLNPCRREGNLSELALSAGFKKHEPDYTSIHLRPFRAAFRIDPNLLLPVDPKLPTALALFHVEEINYSKTGIELVRPDSVCLPTSQIGRTGVQLELSSFIPVIQLDSLTQVPDKDSLFSNERLPYGFVGIYAGKGKLHFDLNGPVSLPVQGTHVENKGMSVSFALPSAQLKLSADAKGKTRVVSLEELQQYFSKKGFLFLAKQEANNTIVKLSYTIK